MNNNRTGLSQVELMITVAVVGTFFLAAVSSFMGIARGLMVSKTRSIATNLAQEKVEYLKAKSYYRLLVTGSTDYVSVGYDTLYYQPETIDISGIVFTRRMFVTKVTESNGVLANIHPNNNDTGLKRIKVTVLWTENGQQQTISINNLFENPDRLPLDCTVSGTITDLDSGSAIADALVYVEENTNWSAETDETGAYTLYTTSGSFRITATAAGYWDNTSASIDLEDQESAVQNLTLEPMDSGTITGYAYKIDNLMISMISPDTEDAADETMPEFVELYNPTTYTISIGPNNFVLKYVEADNDVHIATLSWTGGNPVNIPSNGYCLLGSTSPVTGRNASSQYYSLTPDILFPPGSTGLSPGTEGILDNTKWGIAITDQYGVAIDSVGWSQSGQSAPTNGRETSGVTAGAGGIETENGIIRWSYYNDNSASLGSTSPNGMDTGNNAKDFYYASGSRVYRSPRRVASGQFIPAPSSSYGYGRPCIGAVVDASDDLSSPVNAVASGYYGAAKFTLTSVATGTWQVEVASDTAFGWRGGVTVTNGSTAGPYGIVLSTESTFGFISGRVTSGGTGLSSIRVRAAGGTTVRRRTNNNGYYRIKISTGSYYVTANPGRLNPMYTTETTTFAVEVNLGRVTDGIDFELDAGGGIRGRCISTNGDALPDIVVNIQNTATNEVDTLLTNAAGRFRATKLPVGTYTIWPVLEALESSSPTSYSASVTQGVTTNVGDFTIAGAFATLTGSVTDTAGNSITTGVLLMATTVQIGSGSEPPELSNALRTGGEYYYSTVSAADGSYSLEVRGGYTYNVYAWYTTLVSSTRTATTRKSLQITVAAGSDYTRDYPTDYTGQ